MRVFAALTAVLAAALQAVASVRVHETETAVTLSTEFVQIRIDLVTCGVTGLWANFQGRGEFDKNVLSSPFALEPVGSSTLEVSSLVKRYVKIPSASSQSFRFQVQHLDNSSTLVVTEDWTITLNDNRRDAHVQIVGEYAGNLPGLQALTYGIYSTNPSVTAFTSHGSLQMMDHAHGCLGVDGTLDRAFLLGAGSAVDVQVSAISEVPSDRNIVLHSSSRPSDGYRSGIQHVVAGQYPYVNRDMTVAWSPLCWDTQRSVAPLPAQSWSANFTLVPNDHNFPAYQLANVVADAVSWPMDDLAAYMLGIYGSAAGCLQSYYLNQEGTVAPTIAHPDTGYSPDTNFFDPDNYLTMTALLYSNDEYLQRQVRNVLNRTSQTMCGLGSDTDPAYCNQDRQRHLTSSMRARLVQQKRSRSLSFGSTKPFGVSGSSRTGQLMHHFISLKPTYESIAGSEQLGPNIFWTLTTIRYLALTEDMAFLKEMLPYLELSLQFVLSFIDYSESGAPFMVMAPGPLWIDVLVREYYASDSNAMMVRFLREMSDFFKHIIAGRYEQLDLVNADRYHNIVSDMATIEQAIISNMNTHLWAGDHYVTQQNLNKSTRDFVDYDSNLLAVAFGIPDAQRSAAILKRIDSNPIAHVRATWCSEIPYTGDADDCYIVGGSVCGDSVVTLARIGYADAWARKRVNDINTLKNVLLRPLQEDLLRDVWLYERYDANGTQIRTSYYFEYPALVTMMLRELVYGITVDMGSFDIDPLEGDDYVFAMGSLRVVYSQRHVEVKLQTVASGQGLHKAIRVHKLSPGVVFKVRQGLSTITLVRVDATGMLAFDALPGALQAGIIMDQVA